MELLMERAYAQNLDTLDTNGFYVFGFSGAVPATEAELPFDQKDFLDLFNKSLCCVRSTVTIIGDRLERARFDFLRTVKLTKGYSPSLQHSGKFEVAVVGIETSSAHKSTDFLKRQVIEMASMPPFSAMLNSSLMSSANTTGSWVEFDFGNEVDLTHIEAQLHTDPRYYSNNIDFEYWDGSTYQPIPALTGVDFDALSASKGGLLDLGGSFTTSKVKMTLNVACGSGYYPPNFRFLTSTEPATQPAEENITWFALVPCSIAQESSYILNGTMPLIWGTAGGPNDEKVAAFSQTNSGNAAEIKLLNLKLSAKTLGALK